MTSTDAPLEVHPDRLLPADPGVRAIARRLYAAVEELPIISPHGHVDPRVLLDDEPFRDPAGLLVTPITTSPHSCMPALSSFSSFLFSAALLPPPDSARCKRRPRAREGGGGGRARPVFRGTPMRFWLDAELAEIFDVVGTAVGGDRGRDLRPGRRAADPAPGTGRAPSTNGSGIAVLATTDDPIDDLSAHAALAADDTWSGRVIPTFRPTATWSRCGRGWPELVGRLGKAADVDTGSYAGWVAAMESRRRYFIEHGATSADHSHEDVRTDPLEPAEAERVYAAALRGQATVAEAVALRRHMVLEMARMSCDDGLVMTLHPAVRRDHHRPTAERFGAEVGADMPLRVEYADALRPLLERFGTHPNLHLVVFTVDETVFSRELGPLAGSTRRCTSVQVGWVPKRRAAAGGRG